MPILKFIGLYSLQKFPPYQGILYEDSQSKAEVLNKQFSSVYTKEDESAPLPDIKEKSFPSIQNILVDEKGVLNLLKGMNVNKAAGPDGIPNKILKACAEEVAPALTIIFQESLNIGQLPSEKSQCYSHFQKR